MKILVAGASGYYGKILTKYFIQKNIDYIGVDLFFDPDSPIDKQIICDLRNFKNIRFKLASHKFNAIIHLATELDFSVGNQNNLYKNNIQITKNLINFSLKNKIRKIIFTSSNSIFLGTNKGKIYHYDEPCPIDMYGKSKVDSESILLNHSNLINVSILRCPNIIDAGRVGMLSILFELVECGATLWTIGKGNVRHQCLYAQDLNTAIFKLLGSRKSTVFNIGSDNVPTFREMYKHLIISAKSRSKIRSLPEFLVIPTMKILYKMGFSPMGPYQFRMLSQNFQFDLKEIKRDLNWKPTKNNSQIIELAYKDYLKTRNLKINKSANASPVNMGLLSILKYIKF